jgi:hypothetical protein
MSKFIIAIKKMLNLISTGVPTNNPPQGNVEIFLGGESGNDLMGLTSDGEQIVLAKGTISEE